jgi:hypothetical protein
MFHMRHVPEIAGLSPTGDAAQGYRKITRVLSQPLPATTMLAGGGYETVSIPSVVSEFNLRSTERVIDTGELVQFEVIMLGKTVLGPLIGWLQISSTTISDQGR